MLDKLYMKDGPGPNSRGARFNPERNYSSNARAFGLNSLDGRRDSENSIIKQGGKRLISSGPRSTSNLIYGNYGSDPLTR